MNPQANPLVIAVTVNWKQPADPGPNRVILPHLH